MADPVIELQLDASRFQRVRHGVVAVVAAPAIFRIEGPGAVQCVQGLLTNDVVKPGDDSLVYGALLTPRGMLVVDYWVLRHAGGLTMIAPRQGQASSQDLFRRQLPPRLARVTDHTDTDHVVWLVGEHAFQTLAKTGLGTLPDACGRVAEVTTPAGPLLVALAPEGAPFVALATGAAEVVAAFAAALRAAGAAAGDATDVEANRILRGWPAMGAEIDDRTLPQEVRYDEIGGVSYTKGCYTGQETVARLHFRGHTNRELRGLVWRDVTPLDGRSVEREGREVGTVRSVLALHDRRLALAQIRREVAPGEEVIAGGRAATVVALPFGAAELDE